MNDYQIDPELLLVNVNSHTGSCTRMTSTRPRRQAPTCRPALLVMDIALSVSVYNLIENFTWCLTGWAFTTFFRFCIQKIDHLLMFYVLQSLAIDDSMTYISWTWSV